MSKIEEYRTLAAESLAAGNAAATDRERVFHQRAHAIYRRLISQQSGIDARSSG